MVLKIYFPETTRVLLSIFDHKEMKEKHTFLAQSIMKIVGSLREQRRFEEEKKRERLMDKAKEEYEGVYKNLKADPSKAKKVDAQFTGEIKRKIFQRLIQMDGTDSSSLETSQNYIPSHLRVRGSVFKKLEMNPSLSKQSNFFGMMADEKSEDPSQF